MKVDIIRSTGQPVEESEAVRFREEFKVMYDRAEAKCVTGEGWTRKTDVLRLARLSARAERMMRRNFKMTKTVDLPVSGKQWSSLINEYSAPITLGIHAETLKLVLILQDDPFGPEW